MLACEAALLHATHAVRQESSGMDLMQWPWTKIIKLIEENVPLSVLQKAYSLLSTRPDNVA
jgi:hypothetical protein